ncbi:MAG TPA: DUF6622 family protein [Burkholderiaceae bacterium]|jgi:hypothetical protein|nr:DUF6622 family protein [Burkholderiaceae bacterium]
MLMQILVHTPRWVFVLFFVLVYFGIKQFVARSVGFGRASLLPLAFLGLSLYGVVSGFPTQPLALLAWALAVALACVAVTTSELPAGTAYDARARRFSLPGSPVPLVLMMGIFCTKFVAGVTLATAPQMAQELSFALPIAAMYGAFSGVFLGRAMRLWKLAMGAPSTASATA